MKKNVTKKCLLSIGAISLATLPFVSVISCSGTSTPNNDGDNPGTNPEPDQKPQEIPYLEWEGEIYPVKYEKGAVNNGYKHLPKMFIQDDIEEIKNKINNNEVKIKNEDGSYIKYQLSVTLDPNVIFTNKYSVDPTKPYDNETNQFKILNRNKKLTISMEIDFNPNNENWFTQLLDIENTIAYVNFYVGEKKYI